MSFKGCVFLTGEMLLAMDEVERTTTSVSINAEARDRITDAMIEAAKAGKISEADFVRAGLAAIHEIEKPGPIWLSRLGGRMYPRSPNLF
jgi:hypothetical protein